ncbi:MAG: IMP dehydrogenase [Planctomycetota bacterium]
MNDVTGNAASLVSDPAAKRSPVELAEREASFGGKLGPVGLTFDDVLLVPRYSEIVPSQADVSTHLTQRIRLQIPLVSSPMDTVTESEMAIALAKEGGLGVIHKNLSVEDQTIEVKKVKRSANGIIINPVTLTPDERVGRAVELMDEANVSGIPIVHPDQSLVGILTRRDLRFLEHPNLLVNEVMTRENLVTAVGDVTLEEAERILTGKRVEKLLLVDENRKLTGLITIRDIDMMKRFPRACKDAQGRLRVGAAIGVGDFDRAQSLIDQGVDLLVVDSAHGHSRNVIETVREIKTQRDWNIDVIAGNIATADGADALIQAGADAIKVGIGPGSICTTRVISGVGVPQVSAILDVVQVAQRHTVPVIADGGIRFSGDITKAIAAGASAVMIGSLFAGLTESPGEMILYQGRRFKSYRGMGSMGAMVQGSSDRYRQTGAEAGKLVPEGVEGRVPFKGPLGDYVYQLVGGLRAGMGYVGTRTISELRTDARFTRVSAATVRENHPHDIAITQEAPNYSPDVQGNE